MIDDGRPGPPLPEGRFGPGTAWCPYPERWHSTDGDSTEIEVSELIAGLVRATQPDVCLETGSGWGQTSEAIGRALIANENGRLFTVDSDPERAAYTSARCRGLPVAVTCRSSLECSFDCPIEFAFFDSLYELRVPEFLHFHRHIRPGAVVCFHDTAPTHGAHILPDGIDLQTQIERELGAHLRCVRIRSPRGLTIAEVL